MKLKGLVWFFTIALILISLYQLSFTLVTSNFENKIFSQAENLIKKEQPNLKVGSEAFDFAKKDKARFMLDSLQTKEIYPVIGKTYQECKEQQLNLGLDLQGGMNVVLEVGIDDLVKNLSNNPKDPALLGAINKANTLKANSGADFITLFEQAYNEQNPNGSLAPLFAKSSTNEISFNSTNAQVLTYMRKEAQDAFTRTTQIITSRIDRFGVSQPSVNPDEGKGIITVELAGVQNPEKVRRILQSTAKLEFWKTYSIHEISQNIIDADEALKAYLDNNGKEIVADSNATETASTETKKDTSLSSLLGSGSKKGALDTANLTDDQKMAKFREENPLRSFLLGGFEVRQNDKGEIMNECRVSYVYDKDTAALNRYLNLDVVKSKLPKDLMFLYGMADKAVREKEAISVLYAIKKQSASSINAPLDGSVVVDASQDYDPYSGNPDIKMKMNAIGANKWAALTGENVGRPIAIALDNTVYSAPAPSEQITGGSSNITGSFTVDEAKDLANILKTGKLPAPAKIVQEQVVGPTLGQEAVNGGMLSFFLSFIVIFVLMLVYYNTAGWIANIALILNLLFTVGVLSALGASLTAAGIAGLVLTIGMAVDTNVIIFERIKEELEDNPNDYTSAVDKGYKRSLAPVLDGHITVLMTAIILFIFGLGPVLGFATTQILGILLSLFCGIMVSRLITDIWTTKGRHFKYFTSFSRKLFKSFNFRFIEWRKKAYIISIIVLIAGIGALINGFDYGVEFSGGRSYTVRLDQSVKTNDVRNALKGEFGDFPVVKTIGSANQVNVTTAYKIKDPSREVEAEVIGKLYNGLKAGNFINGQISLDKFKSSVILSSQTVLPTISDDLKKGAIYATVISLLLIMAYIFIRFRRWQYSLGTIIALLHDILVTLAVFSFFKEIVPFSLEIDQHFIAAILTVIGFSMNDTVVVFDRIREYFRKRPGSSKTEVINAAINDTMSRTIMTSLTVFITLLILFIFGGEVTRGFAFAMMIGVFTGTYSSIFVAAPILVDLDRSDDLTKEEDKSQKIEELKSQA